MLSSGAALLHVTCLAHILLLCRQLQICHQRHGNTADMYICVLSLEALPVQNADFLLQVHVGAASGTSAPASMHSQDHSAHHVLSQSLSVPAADSQGPHTDSEDDDTPQSRVSQSQRMPAAVHGLTLTPCQRCDPCPASASLSTAAYNLLHHMFLRFGLYCHCILSVYQIAVPIFQCS